MKIKNNTNLFNKFSARHLLLSMITVVLVFGTALFTYRQFFYKDLYANADNWPMFDEKKKLRGKPAEVLIAEGRVEKPIKILEVTLHFDETTSMFKVSNVIRKKGYSETRLSTEESWKIETQNEDGNIIASTYVNRVEKASEEGLKISKEVKILKNPKKRVFQDDFIVNIPWDKKAKIISVYSPSGTLSDTVDVNKTKVDERKSNFHGISGNEATSKSTTSLFDMLTLTNKASALSNNGVVDITFVSNNFTNMNTFHTQATTIFNKLLTIEPFKSRSHLFRMYAVDNTADLGCVGPTATNKSIACNSTLVKAAVNNAAAPYDKIVVISNNPYYGGVAYINGEIAMISNNYSNTTTNKYAEGGVHEIAHTFNLLDEYYSTNTGTITNTIQNNCLKGSPTYPLWDAYKPVYALGCGTYSNWYRTSPTSLMKELGAFYFNPVSISILNQAINRYLDDSPPTISVKNPATSTTISRSQVYVTGSNAGIVPVVVDAQDNVGVSKVELYEGSTLLSTDTTRNAAGEYNFNWDSTRQKITGSGPMQAGETKKIAIAGKAGIPIGTYAISMDIKTISGSFSGYITVYPCDQSRPKTASSSYLQNSTTSAGIVTKLDGNGEFCVYSSQSANILVDINGYYGSSSGYTALSPAARFTDTRSDATVTSTIDGKDYATGTLDAGATKTIQIAGRGGIPLNAKTVLITLTSVNSQKDGYSIIYSCDKPKPNTSNLNFRTGLVSSNSAIATLSPSGTVCVYASSPTDLIVDVNGYFGATSGYSNLPAATRILDTRTLGDILDGNTTRTINVAGKYGTPLGAKAATMNIVAINPVAGGFITVYPCDATKPSTSALSFSTGTIVSNFVTTKLSKTGTVCISSSVDTHLILDLFGAFSPTAPYVAINPIRILDTRAGQSITTSFAQGKRTIFVKAYDTAGNTTSSGSIILNVTK